MKKYLCSIILFFCVFFTSAQPLGNFNGILNSGGYNGHYEKLLQTSVFPNNVSDLAVDVLLGNYAFWGYIELEVTGDYSHQNTPGKLSKLFAIGINPNGHVYTNESRVTDAIGAVVDNISIGDFVWDAVNSRYRIPISHTVATQNVYTVKVRLFSQGDGSTNIGSQLAISAQYSLPALPRNAVNYNQDLGIGTTVPKNLLHLHGSADGYGYLRISDPVTGNQSTDGARIGFNSGAFRIQNYENSKMSFHVNGSTEALTINNNGHIGIGATSPAYKLDINGGSDEIGLRIGSTNTGANASSLILSNSSQTAFNDGVKVIHGAGVTKFTDLAGTTHMALDLTNAKIGIGTTNPTEKLSVNGNIRAKKMIVSQTGWPDYVFDTEYSLRSLSEIEKFIEKNKHLPDMPSAKEVEEKGISVGDNQALLLKKIEELTLHMIRQDKLLKKQSKQINDLQKKLYKK